jgi:3-oxoacyl-[acyl-carrier-protein] synthase-3
MFKKLAPTRALSIAAISYYLPERVVTNRDLDRENPAWDMDRVAAKTGVFSRHVAADDETALDMSVVAANKLLERYPELRTEVDGIIFCTQTPDYIMPPNSALLHKELGLSDAVFAMDTNLACSGYVYSLAMAQGLINTGTCTNILLVTADTYSRLINPGDRSARSLFGDGAAVTWVKAGAPGIVDLICETSGSGFEKFYIPAGGARHQSSDSKATETTDPSGNRRSDHQIHMDGMGVLSFVNSKVPGQIRRLLERNGIGIDTLDHVILHQASQMALNSLERALGIPSEMVYRNLGSVGNTVSASIPIAIAQSQEEGRIRPDDLVLISGFGVGLSWASALVRM